MNVCAAGALVAILTLALTGAAHADEVAPEPAVTPAPEAPPIPEAPPASEPPPPSPPVPAATPDWVCVPYDAAPCGDGYRVCASDGSGWGACLAGDQPSEARDRRAQPLAVASWQPFSPALRTLGLVVEIGGLLVGTIGLAQWAGVAGDNDGPGPKTLVATGSGAFLSGLVLQYVGSIYAPALDPSDRRTGAPAPRPIAPRVAPSVSPYVGLAGVGLHGRF
jgi:hypothetical protein